MTSKSLKLGPYQIEIQKLHRTVILTIDGKELDLTTEDAEEFYEALADVVGAVPVWSAIWNEPTH